MSVFEVSAKTYSSKSNLYLYFFVKNKLNHIVLTDHIKSKSLSYVELMTLDNFRK